jgi:hypothetical protein
MVRSNAPMGLTRNRQVVDRVELRQLRACFRVCVFLVVVGLSSSCRNIGGIRLPSHDPMDVVFVQVPLADVRNLPDSYPANLDVPSSARLAITTTGNLSGLAIPLLDGFATSAYPSISFNSDSLLFAGRRGDTDPWDIWVVPVAGIGDQLRLPLRCVLTRRITDGDGDSREPIWMPLSSITPPEFNEKARWIGFSQTIPGSYSERGRSHVSALRAVSLDTVRSRGYVNWRTTFNLGRDFSPTMLVDGRVLYASERGQSGSVLMVQNWAGTGLNPFSGDVGETYLHQPTEVASDRSVVCVASDSSAPFGAGRLVRMWMRRPLRTREVISNGPGLYLTPHALPDGTLLVSYAPDSVNFGIYRFDMETGRIGAVVYDDPAYADIDPQALVPRREPQGRITIVRDNFATGDIQCMSVYDSADPRMRSIERGSVRSVRVIEGVPPAEPGVSAIRRVVGEAPVEPDGSFYLRLPADTPVGFQMLDSSGYSVMDMESWVWVRRGSRRGCIGCHEDKELAPQNRLTDALRAARPHVLMPRQHELAPSDSERRTVDFVSDVAPILIERCVSCHRADHRSGLDLMSGGMPGVYQRLTSDSTRHGEPIVLPSVARRSALAWRLLGRQYQEDSTDVRTMPPGGKSLTTEQIRQILKWIDLGASYDTSSDAVSRGDGGAQ